MLVRMDRPTPPPDLARLFNKRGELTAMPVREPLRVQLLEWIASTLPSGRELGELEVNAALRVIDPDVAMLRRYLVDYGLVRRPAPGRYVVTGRGR